MRISDLGYNDRFFENKEVIDFEIENVSLFTNMAYRMVEDLGLTVYTTARLQEKQKIDLAITQQALDLIGNTEVVYEAPSDAFVHTALVRDLLRRVPLTIDRESIRLLSQFANYHIITMLTNASRQSSSEDLSTITLVQLAFACSDLPYPLNLFC